MNRAHFFARFPPDSVVDRSGAIIARRDVSEPKQGCRLMLLVQSGAGAREQLAAVLEATDIASVIIAADTAEAAKPLVVAAQKAGAAALLARDAQLARTLKADGVHLPVGSTEVEYEEARNILGQRFIVGVDAGRSRDAAMRFGEAGAEYIGFGIPEFVGDTDSARSRQLDLIEWWSEIFEVPCVAFDVAAASDAEALARAGADFVAVRLAPAMTPEDARAALRDYAAALGVPAA
jgi:thiamine-phosphate pyrophosphorylase